VKRRHIALAATAIALLFVASVAAERAGMLPDRLSRLVERIDGPIVDKLARKMGIDLPHRSAGSNIPTGSGSTQTRRVDWQATISQLNGIRVAAEFTRGYVRDDWPHWLDADGDCLDTRAEVLLAESTTGASLSKNGCRVLAGAWHDPYTDQDFTDPKVLDVDHMVPLAEAYRSGGHEWTRSQRADYANDLQDPRTLIAVSASANRAKSDKGPEEWLPPAEGYLCLYVSDWISVKARWHLTMDERERTVVGNIAGDCASKAVVASAQ
jgi:hypothetical protein